MAAEMALVKPISISKFGNYPKTRIIHTKEFTVKMSASSSKSSSNKGTKKGIKESLLTPRFYTTDFDEMETLFNTDINKNLNEAEFEALLQEFKTDYNQTHFVRNKEFKEAADKMQGPMRQIFVEFLERSCTAEFSGFLLYKELGRRLKKTNPVVAEIFSLMSRDEARHAGFLNKGLSDFNLALDLGFLTKARKYTFFKPKFIFYATYLSEKIGYWRYITIYRHLKSNPEYQLYPIFKYFENWCQDENRHGDFFSALMKAQPQFLNDWKAKLWSRFFCLSVYVTMYLNDCQRSSFYEGIGLDAKEFDMHVIIEIEYAAKAVDNSGTVVAIKCKDGVVMGVEKLIASKMMLPGSNRRIHSVHRHSGMAVAGLAADGRQIVARAKSEANNYESLYGEQIPVKELCERVASYVHLCTLYWWLRPFGCGVILGGYDRDGPQLYMIEPSGVSYKYYGAAIGKGRQAAKTEIEKLKLSDMTCRQGIIEVAKIIYGVHDEAKDKAFELEMSWVCDESKRQHQKVPDELLEEAKAAAQAALEEMDAD